MPRCCYIGAALIVWRTEFPLDDAIYTQMDKGCHNEAAACEVERNNGSLPKSIMSWTAL